jgi:hypothetical protein
MKQGYGESTADLRRLLAVATHALMMVLAS